MTILVSIVSEQTLPNYLVAKNCEEADYHLFLATSQTIRQFHWLKYSIENHLLKNVLNYIEITSDDYLKNSEILKKNEHYPIFQNSEKIIINITGGTKIMVLSVIDYFKNNFSKKLEIVYLPLNSKEIVYLYPNVLKAPLNSRITTIHEYLNVIGFIKEKSDVNFRKYENTQNILNEAVSLDLFNKYINNKDNKWNQIIKGDGFKDGDVGVFFENLIYHKIKCDFNLNDEQILLNLQIFFKEKGSQDYEYDVVFIYDNNLFLIETKINYSGSVRKILDHYSGIRNIFGLNSKALIFTLREYPNNEHKKIIARSRNFGIMNILDGKEVKEILKNDINIKKYFIANKK